MTPLWQTHRRTAPGAQVFQTMAAGVHPTGITADSSFVYWATDSGQVWKIAK